MCGICGIINFDGQPIDEPQLLRMRQALAHRGPDDCGMIILKPEGSRAAVGLAHRRLAVIDLSPNAHQPMSDASERYFIVYNGEVYNFRELRRELEDAGIAFKSFSDTEVVLYAYILWGKEALKRLNGMFAFAIWDAHKNEVFLARDRFGKKPLYYYNGPRRFAFASELSGLRVIKSIPQKISPAAVNSFLALGYILSPLSMYEQVHKLEPAHYLKINQQGARITNEQYWDYASFFRKQNKDSFCTAQRRISELLKLAVKRRLISDVPVGAFLSGGIDSSVVTALMKQGPGGQLHTFSIGFQESSYDELGYADSVAGALGTIHHSQPCAMDNRLTQLNAAVNAYDELFADTSLVPMVQLAQLAKKTVTVVLSGDGADELFAGYITHKADYYYNFLRYLPVKRAILNLLLSVSNPRPQKLSFEFRLKQFLRGLQEPPQQAHYSWRMLFTPEERVALLGEKSREVIFETDPYLKFKAYYAEVADLPLADQHLYVDVKTWLADDILVKVDRATMHSGLEARCPFLDQELAEYAAALPFGYKFRAGRQKLILRKLAAGLIPRFVIRRKKSGFSAPISRWLKDTSLNEYQLFARYVLERKAPHAV